MATKVIMDGTPYSVGIMDISVSFPNSRWNVENDSSDGMVASFNPQSTIVNVSIEIVKGSDLHKALLIKYNKKDTEGCFINDLTVIGDHLFDGQVKSITSFFQNLLVGQPADNPIYSKTGEIAATEITFPLTGGRMVESIG